MKTSIGITRQMTINTGNYNSAKPSVTFTVDEVPVDKVADVFVNMQYVVDGMFIMERSELIGENIHRKSVGKQIDDALSRINETLKT